MWIEVTSQIIRRFQFKGQTDGARLPQKQEGYRHAVTNMMRDEGFVPLLDVDPVFSWEWFKDDLYSFCYTWHGVFVGMEKAWETEGVLAGKRVPSIPSRK